jgi:hypothetical protein
MPASLRAVNDPTEDRAAVPASTPTAAATAPRARPVDATRPEPRPTAAPAASQPAAAGLVRRRPPRAVAEPGRPPDQAMGSPRFRIFIIDSGWHSTARRVLRDNMVLLQDLTHDPVYLLDKDRSVALLIRHRSMIGRDPIIIVHDMLELSRGRDPDRVHGMRVHLGLLRKEQAVLAALQTLTNFLARFRMGDLLEEEIRKKLRMEGLAGAIEIASGRGPAHISLEL